MKKRLLSIMLAFILVAVAFSPLAKAANPEKDAEDAWGDAWGDWAEEKQKEHEEATNAQDEEEEKPVEEEEEEKPVEEKETKSPDTVTEEESKAWEDWAKEEQDKKDKEEADKKREEELSKTTPPENASDRVDKPVFTDDVAENEKTWADTMEKLIRANRIEDLTKFINEKLAAHKEFVKAQEEYQAAINRKDYWYAESIKKLTMEKLQKLFPGVEDFDFDAWASDYLELTAAANTEHPTFDVPEVDKYVKTDKDTVGEEGTKPEEDKEKPGEKDDEKAPEDKDNGKAPEDKDGKTPENDAKNPEDKDNSQVEGKDGETTTTTTTTTTVEKDAKNKGPVTGDLGVIAPLATLAIAGAAFVATKKRK